MLTRRDFLNKAAIGSTSLALVPFIHQMQARAAGKSAGFPKRFVFLMRSNGMYTTMVKPKEIDLARTGGATGRRANPGNSNGPGVEHDGDLIDQPLDELTLPDTLAALERYKQDMNIVMGLSGRMCHVNHGTRYGALGAYRSPKGKAPTAATVDGILARQFPAIFSHLGLAGGGKDSGTSGGLSAYAAKRDIGYYNGPLEAYNNLFAVVANDPAVQKRNATRGSALDFMAGDVSRFRQSIPAHEREKLDEYLAAFEAMGDRRELLLAQRERLARCAPDVDDRYSSDDMELRMAAHWDLAASALIAGLTNVVAYRLDSGFSGESFSGTLSGLPENCHGIGHGKREENEAMLAWQAENLAKFVDKLSSVKEGDGTMMDNTMIVLFSHYSDGHHSSGYEFPMVTIGNLGGSDKPKFRTGRYVNYPYYGWEGQRTIGSMWNTVLHAASIEQPTFGELDVAIPEQEQTGPLAELLS